MFHILIAPKNPQSKDEVRHFKSFRVLNAALKCAVVHNGNELTKKLNNRYYVVDARTGTIVNKSGV